MKTALPLIVTLLVAVLSSPAVAAEPDYTRTPILMVHGYFPVEAADWVTWGTFRNRLIDEGWPEEYVYAPQFQDTTGCDPDHAREISAWVDQLRTTTGFDKINIVAHSEGGLNTMYYLRYFCGVHKVANFVGLAAAVHGTRMACVDFISCGADEMCIAKEEDGGWRSNPTLAGINECDETLGDILYTSIWSEFDEIIVPQEGSMMAGARNIEMETFAEHGLIFLKDESFNYLKDALLNGTGLNTDGPGWDCIDYCMIPVVADTVEMAEAPETTDAVDWPETVEGDPADVIADDARSDAGDDAHTGDSGPGDTSVPPGDTGVIGRDALADTEPASDLATRDVGTSDDTDPGTPAHSGGCDASSGTAGPLAIIFSALVTILTLRRRLRHLS